MFPRRYFAGRPFAPRYFPQSQGTAPATVVPTSTRIVLAVAGKTNIVVGRRPN